MSPADDNVLLFPSSCRAVSATVYTVNNAGNSREPWGSPGKIVLALLQNLDPSISNVNLDYSENCQAAASRPAAGR